MSVLMALILLAYTTARFINIPIQSFNIDFAGVFLPLQINVSTIVSLLVAALAASGIDWLLQDENDPAYKKTYQHWLLPALTAWILSLPLANLPISQLWWIVFFGGGVLLTLIFYAEFVSANIQHRYYSIASITLSIFAYAMFLMLAISLKALEIRLLLSLPAIFIVALLVSIRIQTLRLTQSWLFVTLAAIAFITVQVAAAFHYWPLSAIAFGMALLGVLYAANSFITSLSLGSPPKEAASEPLVALVAFWLLAFILP